ncbi:ubiquitin-conjugating enzyme E2-binding protein [Cercophora newfieldiana]|uniref:Ubiquitin-conjugating enzyme E2-binding protein n=1 Tax=Cercophora newfieldiana TaxID=92897 RepID=A0AA39YQK6_9PEZI|nr:ubiquitin-conjugating enzyme E2-binding protein [Cercophora newfieldiana]
MESNISVYAELRSYIRTISVAVSLPSLSDSSTRLTVAADGLNVRVSHHGETRQLRLPGKTSLGVASLPAQKQGVPIVEWRLPLSPESASQDSALQETTQLWSATDLEAGSSAECKKCGATVVKDGAVAWKDLPSENWAEMMDFWHCHKPADHGHSHDHSHGGKADEASLAARGYGASSTISAQDGIGFVDLTTLLFSESDCQGLTFSLSGFEQGSTNREDLMETQSHSLNVFCSSCQTQLGFFNFRAAAVTLLKWQVSCKSASGILPDVSECLAATISSTIARSGSSKSLIIPVAGSSEKADQVIHVWVMLSRGIVYSTSAVEGCTPAIKLFYQLISQEEADKMLEEIMCDAQEINLPVSGIKDVIGHLEDSNILLPASERRFKDWKVGLLKR